MIVFDKIRKSTWKTTEEAPQLLLATSSNRSRAHESLLLSDTGGRPLLSDRMGWFDHFRPRRFMKNTIKISMVQFSTIVTNYYNDQLKEDMKREEKIEKGEMTRAQAVKEDEEWQEREWESRTSVLSKRFAVAFCRYHAIVLVTRLYECIAERYVSIVTLDKLTIDTFEAAKREEKAGSSGGSMMREMWTTCWKGYCLSYLADYSVHQVILTFGYYVYIQEQRRRLRDKELHKGSLALSYIRRSTLLGVSRAFGLVLCSIGGAVGSVLYPGWGTLVGGNMGDSLAFQLSEEVESPHVEIKEDETKED